MSGLIIAAVLLAVVLVLVWALAESEHDRVDRARDRAYMNEVHHLPQGGRDDDDPSRTP